MMQKNYILAEEWMIKTLDLKGESTVSSSLLILSDVTIDMKLNVCRFTFDMGWWGSRRKRECNIFSFELALTALNHLTDQLKCHPDIGKVRLLHFDLLVDGKVADFSRAAILMDQVVSGEIDSESKQSDRDMYSVSFTSFQHSQSTEHLDGTHRLDAQLCNCFCHCLYNVASDHHSVTSSRT